VEINLAIASHKFQGRREGEKVCEVHRLFLASLLEFNRWQSGIRGVKKGHLFIYTMHAADKIR
jgi:hypothetical protein